MAFLLLKPKRSEMNHIKMKPRIFSGLQLVDKVSPTDHK